MKKVIILLIVMIGLLYNVTASDNIIEINNKHYVFLQEDKFCTYIFPGFTSSYYYQNTTYTRGDYTYTRSTKYMYTCTQEDYNDWLSSETQRIASETGGSSPNNTFVNTSIMNITYNKVSASVGNFDLITDNSPVWNHGKTKSQQCLLDTDLSSVENMHNTICPELQINNEIIINKVVRMIWYWSKEFYNTLLDHNNRLVIAQQRVTQIELETCLKDPTYSWC